VSGQSHARGIETRSYPVERPRSWLERTNETASARGTARGRWP